MAHLESPNFYIPRSFVTTKDQSIYLLDAAFKVGTTVGPELLLLYCALLTDEDEMES